MGLWRTRSEQITWSVRSVVQHPRGLRYDSQTVQGGQSEKSILDAMLPQLRCFLEAVSPRRLATRWISPLVTCYDVISRV